MKEMKVVKTVTVGKLKYFLITNGYRKVFYKATLNENGSYHILSGYEPCPMPEGKRVVIEAGKCPYLVKK
jgi:hypothetical protein|tara:strand:+ start:3825 stop:4034 length:210 start_codon:yes stop_codon:yes gene_type:complete